MEKNATRERRRGKDFFVLNLASYDMRKSSVCIMIRRRKSEKEEEEELRCLTMKKKERKEKREREDFSVCVAEEKM